MWVQSPLSLEQSLPCGKVEGTVSLKSLGDGPSNLLFERAWEQHHSAEGYTTQSRKLTEICGALEGRRMDEVNEPDEIPALTWVYVQEGSGFARAASSLRGWFHARVLKEQPALPFLLPSSGIPFLSTMKKVSRRSIG